MPIKIFAAPGDHRDDFQTLERQVNEWIAQASPRIVDIRTTVNPIAEKREHGGFMMTLAVHHEDSGG